MKIVIVNRYHPKDVLGGSEIQCSLLQNAWQELGHDVLYVSLDGCGQTGEFYEEKQRCFRLSSSLSQKTFKVFEKLLKRENPDYVYLRSFNQLFFCERVCRKLSIPCTYNTCNQTDLMFFRPIPFMSFCKRPFLHLRGFVNRWLNWRTLFQIPIITINQEHADYLNQRKGRAQCIYNSMVDRYPDPPPKKEKKICWVANIKERKRPELFFQLVRRLSGNGWEFVMVGALQNNKEAYEKMLRNAQEQFKDFKWYGPLKVEQVDQLLASSYLLVNTCEPEGFGNNFIQAWYAKCPTISYEFDADDVMKREAIGFCPKTVEGMVSHIELLMNDEQLRQKMGEAARKWAKEKHNLRKNAQKYLDFISSTDS